MLDPLLRVIGNIPFHADYQDTERVARYLQSLPPVDEHAGTPLHAPVLIIPRVLEPGVCQYLIDLYKKNGGERSGFMCEENGMTVCRHDDTHKKRLDFNFSDQTEFDGLRSDIQRRIRRRIVPEVKKAFQFEITRVERYVVACYTHRT